MLGSRFEIRPAGIGFLPILLAAASIGAGIYQQKQEEKAAADQAKQAEDAAAKLAVKARKAATVSSSKWPWIVGGVAVAGVAVYVLTRRRR